MYPASDWSVVLRAIMEISARAFSLADRPRPGHPGHRCSHALGRPILHFILSSRRPRLETVDRVTSSLAPHIGAVPLFEPKGRSFVPARRTSIASRAGAVKAGRRAWLTAGSGVARLRLDSAEHGARITRVGRRRSSSSAHSRAHCSIGRHGNDQWTGRLRPCGRFYTSGGCHASVPWNVCRHDLDGFRRCGPC
jgi:hypothetical protein